jgi:NAD(P)H-dependent FMN reductase
MVTIKIIAGSTRPGRFNRQVAEWVFKQTRAHEEGARFELVDLADINLPLLDEAIPPSRAQYEKPHTKAWAKVIGEADGFVIVAPEYNHSVPGALKNAIDYLYAEWNFKPVTFVSYGSAAGGARSVEHLRGIAGELKMYDLREQLLLPNYWNNMSEHGEYQFTDEHESILNTQLGDLVFWAKHMRPARQQLHS